MSTTKAPTTELSGLNRTALGLAVYASSGALRHPTQNSLPAAGQALPGGIQYPQGSYERFFSCNRYIRSPFPKLCLAQGHAGFLSAVADKNPVSPGVPLVPRLEIRWPTGSDML